MAIVHLAKEHISTAVFAPTSLFAVIERECEAAFRIKGNAFDAAFRMVKNVVSVRIILSQN